MTFSIDNPRGGCNNPLREICLGKTLRRTRVNVLIRELFRNSHSLQNISFNLYYSVLWSPYNWGYLPFFHTHQAQDIPYSTDTCTNNGKIFAYLPFHSNSHLLPYTYTFEISFNSSPFILNVMKNANNPYDEMSFNSHQHVNDESTVLQQTHKHLMYGEDRLFCWYCNKTQIYSNIFKKRRGNRGPKIYIQESWRRHPLP